MALTASTSVQVSSVGATGTRASCIASPPHANFTKERQNLNLPTCNRRFKMPTFSLPSPRITKRFRPTFVCRAQNTVAEVLEVTEGTWSKLVVESGKLVLVDFWAPWCGPCRMIAPVIDELAKEYVGKVTCYKLNTDDSPGIATQYGIRSIPTVLVFKDGEKKESVIGAVPKSTLTATIEKYLEA
ncbi:hypothetical protein ACLOJK_013930 [Asimina triloba]